jgi:cation diffusion facilitator family transporter
MSVPSSTAPVALRRRTALLSVASNSTLIVLKAIAGTLTGSVAVLTEAVHSSVDLVASIVAYLSISKAGEPADESHRYGHEKLENLSAALEGMLILVGSVVIAFAAIRRLLGHGETHNVGIGIVVVGLSVVVNLAVSYVIGRTAKATGSPALEGDAAHLRTDAISSASVLVALVLVGVTGKQWIDPVVALAVACALLITGVRLLTRAGQVLVDQALPVEDVRAVGAAIEPFASRGVVGYHELRTRRAGTKRYVDVHVQFRSGTSLEEAHRTAHVLKDAIAAELAGADVLIHIEPEDMVRPGEELTAGGDVAGSVPGDERGGAKRSAGGAARTG